jgi:hypothetical protein
MARSRNPNHYEVLGAKPTDTPDVIEGAYFNAMAACATKYAKGAKDTKNVMDDKEAKREAAYQVLEAAYEVLKDHAKRLEYDQKLQEEAEASAAAAPVAAAPAAAPAAVAPAAVAPAAVAPAAASSAAPPAPTPTPAPAAASAPAAPLPPVAAAAVFIAPHTRVASPAISGPRISFYDEKYIDNALSELKAKGLSGSCTLVTGHFPEGPIGPSTVPAIIVFYKRSTDSVSLKQGYKEVASTRFVYHKTRGWITPNDDTLKQDITRDQIITSIEDRSLSKLLNEELSRRQLTCILPQEHERTTIGLPVDVLRERINDGDKSQTRILHMYFQRILTQSPSPEAMQLADLTEEFLTLAQQQATSGFFGRATPQTVAAGAIRKALETNIIGAHDSNAKANAATQEAVKGIYNAVKDLDFKDPLRQQTIAALKTSYRMQYKQAKKAVLSEELTSNFEAFKTYSTATPLGMKADASARRRAAKELYDKVKTNEKLIEAVCTGTSKGASDDALKKLNDFSKDIQQTLESTKNVRPANSDEKLTGVLTNLKESIDVAITRVKEAKTEKGIKGTPRSPSPGSR